MSAPSSRVLRARLAAVALVAVALVLVQPLRQSLLTVLRWPFTALRAGVHILLLLPRLPVLLEERGALRAQLARRELELADAREQLRRILQTDALRAETGSSGILAGVIGRSTVPTQHTLLLDRGRQHGLALEAVIVDASGVLGRVIDVQPATALALLITDPESRIAALVERSRETGLLLGQGLGQCELVYLEAQADVEAGDRVVTAGLGGPFPKGLLLGFVARVARDEAAGTAVAAVRPAAQLGQAEDVLCLPPARAAAP